jgi:retinol-binding protein 3
VPKDDALIVAQLDALKRLREKSASPDDSLSLAWSMGDLESQMHPVKLSKEDLAPYVGVYGPRSILLDGETLQYQRQGRPKIALVPMGKDLFHPEGMDAFRLRFDRDLSGQVVGLTGMYNDGRQESNPRER